MKHGKNPTVKQMRFMQSLHLNPDNWLVSRDTPSEMVIIHRFTDSVKTIEKGGAE